MVTVCVCVKECAWSLCVCGGMLFSMNCLLLYIVADTLNSYTELTCVMSVRVYVV